AFTRNQPQLQSLGNVRNHLVLQREDVGPSAIKTLRPQVTAGLGIDQLGVDAHVVAGAADTAFKDVTDTEFGRHLRWLSVFAFVAEGSVARGHAQRARLSATP